MRGGSLQTVARPAYIDRNPINQTKYSNTGSIAGHAGVQRWTYTVPVGKKAQIDTLFMQTLRTGAAAPVGTAINQVAYTPNGGTLTLLVVHQLITNGVGDEKLTGMSQLGDMLAGDIIAASDSDSSTGGTVEFVNMSKIFEFDA